MKYEILVWDNVQWASQIGCPIQSRITRKYKKYWLQILTSFDLNDCMVQEERVEMLTPLFLVGLLKGSFGGVTNKMRQIMQSR